MHLCFICDEYPPGKHGGVGSFTQTLARSLARRGHRLTVVGLYDRDRAGMSDDEGVRVIRVARCGIRGSRVVVNVARLRACLARLHQEAPIDLLEAPNSLLSLVSARFPLPKVMRMHGGHRFFAAAVGRRPHLLRAWHETRAVGRADFLCAVSRYTAETNRALLKLGSRPIEILPNPIDTGVFRPRPEIAEDPGLVLYMGTLCEKKGVRELIAATPTVLDEVPGARLLLVGRDSPDPDTGGSYRERLRRMLPNRLLDRVTFREHVQHHEVPELLARAQVCVCPSLMEAHPIAWLEAMAMGKPVVASKLGPGPEVIEDGQSGLLCNPRDTDELADRIVRVLTSSKLRRALSEGARQRAVTAFAVEPLTTRNESFYECCVQSWRCPVSERTQ